MITHKLQIKQRKFNVNGNQIKKNIKGCNVSPKDIKKLWEEYLINVKEKLIEKGEVNLKCNIGNLCVYKIAVSDHKIRNKSLILTATEIKRIGQHYFITLDNDNNIKFKSNEELNRRLKKELIGNKEYKPAPLKYIKTH